jgi:hypothetical protein
MVWVFLSPLPFPYGMLFQISLQLLKCLNLPYSISIMVFTMSGIEPSADGRAVFIDLTAIAAIKMLAAVLNIKVPFPVLNKNRCSLMADIPTNVFKVIPGCWLINFHGKILAAKPITFLTRSTHTNPPLESILLNPNPKSQYSNSWPRPILKDCKFKDSNFETAKNPQCIADVAPGRA